MYLRGNLYYCHNDVGGTSHTVLVAKDRCMLIWDDSTVTGVASKAMPSQPSPCQAFAVWQVMQLTQPCLSSFTRLPSFPFVTFPTPSMQVVKVGMPLTSAGLHAFVYLSFPLSSPRIMYLHLSCRWVMSSSAA